VSRTLVLSLLRAGDALVHLPALAALREADPGGELHVLVQAAAGPVVDLMATQAIVHRLPKDYLGGPLGPCAPLVESLKALRFDLVANLTHRWFAGELAASLCGRRTLGFEVVDGRPAVSSPWLSVLNDWGTSPALSVLHYGEVACQALGLAAVDPGLGARLPPESLAWWRGARDRLGSSGGPLVALQLTTSEPKKTYPLDRWRALSTALAGMVPGVRQVALAAPGELALVSSALEGAPATALACSLPQAAALLGEAALLVTGDTALVHLGALLRAPVLLLSSGSSAFRELGPAGAGHAVLQAHWPCAPCRHDRSCLASATGYPCTESVAPELAAEVAAAMVKGGALPEGSLGGKAALFRSNLDVRGLVEWRPVGFAPPDTACAELLREHLLEGLPVAAAAPGALAQPARKPGEGERASLLELRAAAGAARGQAEGRDPGALARRVPTLNSPFVLAFAAAVGERLREAPRGLPELAAEMSRLERRLAGLVG
jgi:ADP-heptose:LPS heptosyltransferase